MRYLITFTSLVLAVVGCTSSSSEPEDLASTMLSTEGPDDSAELVAADDTAPADNASMAEELALSQKLITTANLNLRRGAKTTFAVVAVIPEGSEVTLVDATPVNGFLRIDWNGKVGWSSATYLEPSNGESSDDPVDVNGPPSRDNTIARAKAAVGFSYWWGHGTWLPTGPTASTKGICKKISGSGCPNCTHSGQYGADCSGLVAKAWQYGAKDLATDSHPYGTVHLAAASSKWSTIPKSALKRGDALVYNHGSNGHTMIWEKKDSWDANVVYECKGCAEGCVLNTRTDPALAAYKAIRRTGF